MTDPIADMLTRIRNAQAVKKEEVIMPFSKVKLAIAEILAKEGFVGKVEKFLEANCFGSEFAKIKIELRYTKNGKEPLIRCIRRISKPGLKVYKKYNKLPHVLSGLGISIVSTPAGIMTNKEARRKKTGGEIICEVY